MNANETPAVRGLENPGGRRVRSNSDTTRGHSGNATPREIVDAFLAGRIAAHEMPWPLPLVYSQGFRDGQEAAHARVRAAEAAADSWYYVANNPTQVRAEHERTLKLFRVALARKSEAERWAELDRIAAERAEAARG